MVTFPPVPLEVKPIAHLLKLAENHDETNIVVAYWARKRLPACYKISARQEVSETADLLRKLLDWLEETKVTYGDNDAILTEPAAQIIIEESNSEDFYNVAMLIDVLEQFGQLTIEMKEKRRYAKWKAMYIHNCLKAGDKPLPGPPRGIHDTPTAIVHNSSLTPEELATYTKYTGNIPSKH
ncbi:hypothetical protein NQ318_012857 [Aromia moschata]|uniref:Vta1/callose synthase N-terminal domain-containing protein n=1 Tax=Aromia moschata TaxID=1265417 RepID=A0AAV8YED0_9CUCU|nr:hypothetical protein NQ318_012857 [Aromia moschata]